MMIFDKPDGIMGLILSGSGALVERGAHCKDFGGSTKLSACQLLGWWAPIPDTESVYAGPRVRDTRRTQADYETVSLAIVPATAENRGGLRRWALEQCGHP